MIATLLNAVAANSTSAPLDLGTAVSDDIAIETILAGGTPTFSLQLQGSEDGVTYVNLLGTAIAAAGLVKANPASGGLPPVRFLQAVLTGYVGPGTITVEVNTIPLV